MKEIKQIILIYKDNSIKGYNLNAFMKVLKIHFGEYLKNKNK